MDAVFYLLDTLRLFRGKSMEEVRQIAFEIGMLGRTAWTRAAPRRRIVLVEFISAGWAATSAGGEEPLIGLVFTS